MLKEKILGLGAKIVFMLSKNSPEILLGVGIASVVAGTVIACKQTLEVSPILEEYQRGMRDIKDLREGSEKVAMDPALPEGTLNPEYDEKTEAHDKFVVTTTCIGKLALHYALPAALIAAGVGVIIASHNIMAARYATICSAYSALAASTGNITNVEEVEEGGDIHVTRVNDKALVDYRGFALPSPTSAYIGEDNFIYKRGYPEAFLFDLKRVQDEMQTKLDYEGHLFLNTVFERLGLPDTDTGAIVGWSSDGGGVVNFGVDKLIDPMSEEYAAFKDNPPDYQLLIFNCDPTPLYGRVNPNVKQWSDQIPFFVSKPTPNPKQKWQVEAEEYLESHKEA